MQVNIVQTLSQTTSKTTSNVKDTSQNEKDFSEVLKTEQKASEAKKDEPKKQDNTEGENELNLENSAILLMPNIQEILNNIKNQGEKAVNSENVLLVSTEENQTNLNLIEIASANENSQSEIKILDVNLLKTTAEIPKELMDKISSLISEGKSSKTDLKSNLKTQDSEIQVITPQNTQNASVVNEVLVNKSSVVNQAMSPEYVNEINNLIADNVANGKTDFVIQLNPENLGLLTIKASFEDGKSIVSIICSDLKALDAVQRGADDLALILQNKTGQETQVILESPKSDYLDNQSEHHDNNNGQNQQNEDQNKNETENSQEFLQYLRLGLMDL